MLDRRLRRRPPHFVGPQQTLLARDMGFQHKSTIRLRAQPRIIPLICYIIPAPSTVASHISHPCVWLEWYPLASSRPCKRRECNRSSDWIRLLARSHCGWLVDCCGSSHLKDLTTSLTCCARPARSTDQPVRMSLRQIPTLLCSAEPGGTSASGNKQLMTSAARATHSIVPDATSPNSAKAREYCQDAACHPPRGDPRCGRLDSTLQAAVGSSTRRAGLLMRRWRGRGGRAGARECRDTVPLKRC